MKKLLAIVIINIIIASMAGCDKKKDDNSKKKLILLILDQMSGNCVIITRNAAGTRYDATGSKLPKGACSDKTTYTTDAAAAKSAGDAGFDTLIAVAAGTNCSAINSNLTTIKASQTVTTYTAGAKAATSGCVPVFGVTEANPMVYCKDQASVDAYKLALTTSSTSSTIRYYVTSDVTTDMAASFADLQATQTANIANSGFTAAAIAAGVPIDPANATQITSPAFAVFFNALVMPACANDILNANSSLKTEVARMFGKGFSGAPFNMTAITAADAAAVSSVVLTIEMIGVSLKCGYGSAFIASTTAGSVQAACPSSYPTW